MNGVVAAMYRVVPSTMHSGGLTVYRVVVNNVHNLASVTCMYITSEAD